MNEITFPTPSTHTLIKATIIALLIALILFITIILPVEFGYDPTGSGKFLNLVKLTEESAIVEVKAAEVKPSLAYQENITTVVVPPQRGIEYKFSLPKYGRLSYQWHSNNQPLYFDFHGEPKGDTTGFFESYVIATTDSMEGTMTVPFEGVHGWYWKNTTDNEITVTLSTQGEYEIADLSH